MILYFSGTGNSLDVARRLAAALTDECVSMLSPDVSIDGCERVVWVFPVHSWGVPPVVLDAIGRLCRGANTGLHHMVATCGDDAGLTDRQWREAVEACGCPTGCAFTVEMPNTYIDLPGFDVDPPQVRDAKLAALPARISAVAASITDGDCHIDVVRGAMPWLKSKVVYPWFMRHAIRPGAFRSIDACVGCGQCASVCPVGNVSVVGRRPVWGNDCTGCLACYHICPCGAVTHGPFSRGKGRYVNPALREKSCGK